MATCPPVRTRRGASLVVVATLVLAVGVAVPGPAGALGGVSIDRNPVPVALGSWEPVRISWTGQPPGTLVFATVCRRPTASFGFNVAGDCAALTEVNPNGTPTGSGSAELPVFRGPDPGGDNAWGCFAPEDVAPPGIEKVTTCYVRLTNNVVLNNDDAVEVAFTLTGRGAPPPRPPLGQPLGPSPAMVSGEEPVVAPAPPPPAPLEPTPIAFAG